MNTARWYPTCTTLDTGEVLITAGTYATADVAASIADNPLPQVWNPGTGVLRDLSAAQKKLRFYPYMFVDPTQPSGGAFYAGPEVTQPGEDQLKTMQLSTSGLGSWTTLPASSANYLRHHHEHAPAVMYEPGKILVAGGGAHWAEAAPDKIFEWIDLTLTVSSPAWTMVEPMNLNFARRHHNGTLLPDGTVLVTGGDNSAIYNPFPSEAAPVKTAELWGPVPGNLNPENRSQWTWTKLSDCPTFRGYHSTALLLPDGRVFSAGGNFDNNAEIFSPPYLFKGPRPGISSISASTITYGQPFTVITGHDESVSRVTFLRLGSVTHSFNANQRFLNLSFTGGAGVWTVTAPTDPRQCPPGHYMLFLISGAGVPSVAKIVQILPANPPEVVMVCPANGGFVQPYQQAQASPPVPERPIKVSARVKNPSGVLRVEFYQGLNKIGEVATSPTTDGHYSMTWNQTAPGQYILKAIAVKSGSQVESPLITVTVNNFPVVTPFSASSLAPSFGTKVINNASFNTYHRFPITITASATDADGPISWLELYAVNSYPILLAAANNVSSLVHNYTWPRARSGLTKVSAIARDNVGCESGTVPDDLKFLLFGGALDTTFATTAGADGTVKAVAIQADGNILIGGEFTMVDGTTRNRIARLDAYGGLDGTFVPPTIDAPVNAIAIQSDGKIIVVGDFTTINGATRNGIARLNAGGSLDNFSFNPSANGSVNTVVPQADGKILIGGAFTTVNAASRNGIARLNTDGNLDAGFDPNANGTVNAILNSGNEILIGGSFTTVGGVSHKRIARFSAGIRDDSFNPGINDGSVNAIAKSGTQIVIGGSFTTITSGTTTTTRNRIARLNAGGSLDTSFDPGTVATGGSDPTVYSVAVQSDGKVLVAGGFIPVNNVGRNRIARLYSNGTSAGTLDDYFRPGPANNVSAFGPNAAVRALAIDADGMIVIGGEFTTYNVAGLSAFRGKTARIGGL